VQHPGSTSLQFSPFHVHVALSSWPDSALPPKSTATRLAPSKVMAAPPKIGGAVGGNRCVQVVPSQIHVWPSRNAITSCRTKSYAIAGTLAGGAVAGKTCVHVVPSHVHVSSRACPS